MSDSDNSKGVYIMISKAEQKRRRKAVEYSITSCELEGCIIPDSYRALCERYINGELSVEELGNIVRKDLPKT